MHREGAGPATFVRIDQADAPELFCVGSPPAETNRIKAVVFDLDGTLVESYSAHIQAWIRSVAAVGVYVQEEDVRPHMGRSSDDISRALLGQRPESQISAASARKDREYYEILPRVLEPVEGASETLSELRRRGFKISVASSNPTRIILRSLEAVGLNGLADSVTSQDEVSKGKPAPDLFLRAAEKLGVDGRECLAVGDTCYDVLGARSAGMLTAGIAGGVQTKDELAESQPDYLLGTLKELMSLLGCPRDGVAP